ncbi:Rrf2 family transcriptional regulator [Paenibacillus sp. JX-17]|uniref:Rrf2 family transcriptional regulator n=1 Tax=Paenibacillus lacisoli TaxID=3064525 RepID=A0ABT9C8W6_9BACL|nr:Rrf2 family transcriptional regulator [Paenibacillus sp. JX-17]MDO7905700.1 Rrf2 family transcriptional regulator [Paenibacillus sp. JX-17]
MSTHFSVSIHCLLLLSMQMPERITSAVIASSINTNPVVVRRTMAYLKKAGMVTSSPGTRGFYLAMPSDQINLAMVYRATKDQGPLFSIHSDTNQNCEVGRSIDQLLSGIYGLAENKVLQFFETVTLQELEQSLREQINEEDCAEGRT